MWRSQAEADGLTLLKADNKTGYYGVSHQPGYPKPYKAKVRRGGNKVHLGSFAGRAGGGERRSGLQRRRR